MVSSPYFTVRVDDVQGDTHFNLLDRDSFVILMALEGDCRIRVTATGEEVMLRHGYSAMLPAAIAEYDLLPQSGSCKVIDAYL